MEKKHYILLLMMGLAGGVILLTIYNLIRTPGYFEAYWWILLIIIPFVSFVFFAFYKLFADFFG